jgi:hypothetical protein
MIELLLLAGVLGEIQSGLVEGMENGYNGDTCGR